jgi:hypothetical protein
MFDLFKSSYNLGEQFTDVVCQTKDIEYGIGGSMTLYWLSPAGELWKPQYIGTHDLKVYKEGDPEYDSKLSFMNFKWIPTGSHGKYIPHKITKYIEVYPEKWDKDLNNWPRCRLHFIDGRLKDFKDVTGKQY